MNSAAAIGSAFKMKKFNTTIPDACTVHYAGKSLYRTEAGAFPIIYRNTSLPDGSVSADDFMKQLFPEITKQELFDIFKTDLAKELASGAISKIKYHRLIAQMTQYDLAQKTGMKQANIARIESAGYTPTLKTIKKIAAAFGVEVKELL